MAGEIIGWAHTRFGKLADQDLESLIVTVAQDAAAHAGVDLGDIDEIYVGNFNSGMDPQGFPASLALQAGPALRFKPVTRVENACATGSAAIHQGLKSIAAGDARVVLVIGAEKMTATSGADVGRALVTASYVKDEAGEGASFAGVFAQIASGYFQRFGDQSDALARIAAKNHRNGASNPFAHMQKDVGYDFCRSISDSNPLVVAPLRRTDCSMVSDGAAAVVLAAPHLSAGAKRAIRFRAAIQVNDYLPLRRRDMTRLEGCEQAWHQAFAKAKVGLGDLAFVETHDCFTIAELMEYEAMGLTPRGEGARAIEEGWTEPDGTLPVNLSGGLKAKGHPIGATGVSMHVMSAMQLCGEAVGVQLAHPTLGGIFNMGGAGVANYVSILERRV